MERRRRTSARKILRRVGKLYENAVLSLICGIKQPAVKGRLLYTEGLDTVAAVEKAKSLALKFSRSFDAALDGYAPVCAPRLTAAYPHSPPFRVFSTAATVNENLRGVLK